MFLTLVLFRKSVGLLEADVVYRIADKIENDFPYVINDEAIYRYKKGVCDDVSNK